MKFRSFLSFYKFITFLLYTFFILILRKEVLSQDSCVSPPTRPPNKLVGYYPAYKYNSLKPGRDFNISPSIDYLYFVAYGPTDLVNNSISGGDPATLFTKQSPKLSDLVTYRSNNPNLKYKLILSVLLPTDGSNLTKFFNINGDNSYDPNSPANMKFINGLVSVVATYSFVGIDIDYPVKFQCNPSIGFNFSDFTNSIASRLTLQTGSNNKMLTITAGQYPPANMNFENINFVNIQAFRLNVDTSYASAGIDQIKTIRASWNSAGLDDQKLVLGVEFGGIAEVVTSDNIRADIVNQQLHVTNGTKFTFNSEPIPDQCKSATYGYLTWTNLNLSSSSCTTNLIPSSPWLYDFLNNSELPYLYQQYLSSKFYFVVFYENYQSLNAKIDFVNSNNLAGIAIADITKDSNDLQLTNFILGTPPQPTLYNGTISNNTSPSAPTSSTPRSSSNNTGAIVGGVIGSIAFVAIVAVAGFMLYKKRRYNVRGTGGTTKAVGTVEAMFDYVGKEASDLSFRAGDKIEVLERGDGPNDWWVGRLYDRVGEFPGNYVKEINM